MGPVSSTRASGVSGVSGSNPSDAAAKALINDARSHLGWHEGPNNANPYTQEVMGDAHQPWCAAFVSKMLKNQNIPGISGKMWSASAAGLASQFQHAGRYFPRGSQPPQPGDVIFFGGRGNEHHTGIVEKVENGKVYTVEGNTSDAVHERVYDLNSPGIGGYGRVFGGQVSNDLGLDTSKANQGASGNAPAGRAQGRGTAGRAMENGIDPAAYFNSNSDLLFRLLLAMMNGDPAAVEAALAQLLPNVSKEDLHDLAKVLKSHPQLAAKVARHPELLQQLAVDHSEKAINRIMKAKDTGPVDADTQKAMSQLLSSPELKDRAHAERLMKPLLKQLDPNYGRGWSAVKPAPADSRGWQP